MKTSKNATVEMPKWYTKAQETISKLEQIKKDRPLSPYEMRRLSNARYKVDCRSVSRIYEFLFKAEKPLPEIIEAFPSRKFPTFRTWVNKMKKRDNGLYSVWDGLGAAFECSVIFQTGKKLKKQGGTVVRKKVTA